jgi:hypothetical protein
MLRLLLGSLCAVFLGLAVGCGGSGETEVIEIDDAAALEAEAEAYEAEMESLEPEGDG